MKSVCDIIKRLCERSNTTINLEGETAALETDIDILVDAISNVVEGARKGNKKSMSRSLSEANKQFRKLEKSFDNWAEFAEKTKV